MIFYKIGSIPSGRLLISPKETDPVFCSVNECQFRRNSLFFITQDSGASLECYQVTAMSSWCEFLLAKPPVSQTIQVPRLHSTSEPRGWTRRFAAHMI